MKKISGLLLVLFCSVQLSFAGSGMSKWPALKAVHNVISQTYHPSEEGNLVPVKARANELYSKAQILLKSKIPKEFDNDKVREAAGMLEKEARRLQLMIKENVGDPEIKEQLSLVHDTLHDIVGLCGSEDEPEEE